jgi:hypothetical protein
MDRTTHVLDSIVGFCQLFRIILLLLLLIIISLSTGMLSVDAQNGGLHWYFGRFIVNYCFLRKGLVREVTLYYTGPQRNFDCAK